MHDNKSNKLVMKGDITNTDKMWYLQMDNEDHQQHDAQQAQQANSVYELRKQKDIVDFLSQSMWSPVPATWIEAINAGLPHGQELLRK